MATGAVINVAGLTIRPHRPPTRSGRTVVFFSLEDEHGMLDITTFEDVYQRYGKVIYTEPALIVKGRVERRGNAVSLTAFQIRDLPRAYRRDAPAPPERIIRDNTARGQRALLTVRVSAHRQAHPGSGHLPENQPVYGQLNTSMFIEAIEAASQAWRISSSAQARGSENDEPVGPTRHPAISSGTSMPGRPISERRTSGGSSSGGASSAVSWSPA